MIVLITILLILLLQYTEISERLFNDKYESKKAVLRDLIPFRWILFPFEELIKKYKKLK